MILVSEVWRGTMRRKSIRVFYRQEDAVEYIETLDTRFFSVYQVYEWEPPVNVTKDYR